MYFVAQSHIIQILIPYLLGFFRIYCRHPHLPLNGSNCSSMQTAEPIKYNDLHKPMNLSQISRNAAILSSKRRPVLVALSSNLVTDKRNRKRFLPWLQGKLILLSHPFYTVTLCVRVKFQTLRRKSTNQWQHEVQAMTFAASISERCQWSWRDNHAF